MSEYPGLPDAIIATVQNPFLILDERLRVIRGNASFFRDFKVNGDDTVGRLFYELGDGQWNIPALRRLLENILPQRQHVENYRVEHDSPTLGRRTMFVNGHRIVGEGPRPGLILLSILDVTKREKARYELEGQREYSEKLIDSIREALIVLGRDLRVKHVNQPFYDMFKVVPAHTEGRLIYEIGNGQWNIPKLRRLLEDILSREESFDDFEVLHNFEIIGPRHMILNARRLDHLDLIVLAIEDVTQRDQIHRRQKMLASEMSHRVKNILTLVDSIAAQTISSVHTLEDFQSAFHGRLRALARSHGQWLSEESLEANLNELLRDTAECSGAPPQRLILAGPDAKIDPAQTLALNLTFHELFTNAIKYGALSTDSGHVDLTWTVEDGNKIRILWKESGGPQVSTPENKSFGLHLIETLCPFELEGTAKVSFAAEGLRCELTFKASQ